MVIQNRLKGSSHNQAHKIRKGLIPDGNGNEIGGYLIIIPIKFQALGKSVIHRKKWVWVNQWKSSEGCHAWTAKHSTVTGI